MSAHGWTCFHCGDHFDATVEGRALAREHFGPTPDITPECIDRRTTSHAQAIARARQAEGETRQAIENATRTEEALECEQGRIERALHRMGAPSLEAAVDELRTLRLQAYDAAIFSRVVHRLRPTLWDVAMVDACGPGTYYPPRDPGPRAERMPTNAQELQELRELHLLIRPGQLEELHEVMRLHPPPPGMLVGLREPVELLRRVDVTPPQAEP